MSTVKKQIQDKDLANAEVALRRAAQKARTIAEQTHTPLVVYEGGQVVEKLPGKGRGKRA